MELILNGKNVHVKSIDTAATEIIQHINDRRKGLTKSLKTRWKNYNKLCNGGIEPNTLVTIAGISGSGKSSFVNTLETDLIDLNLDTDIIILNFSLEMMSSRQVGRKISTKVKKTTSELYSSNSAITEDMFNEIQQLTDKMRKYPIFYIEDTVDSDTTEAIIQHFQETIAKNKWLIITFDHTLLVGGTSDEKRNIDALQKVFMRRKKVGKTTIIQISQLNRTIENSDRITNPTTHYPMRSDLSTSDFMFQSSDYVAVLHRPEILGISSYGTNRLPTKNMLYLHILKNREGEAGILPFTNDLKYNNVLEVSKSDI